jgi:hypothetical protein
LHGFSPALIKALGRFAPTSPRCRFLGMPMARGRDEQCPEGTDQVLHGRWKAIIPAGGGDPNVRAKMGAAIAGTGCKFLGRQCGMFRGPAQEAPEFRTEPVATVGNGILSAAFLCGSPCFGLPLPLGVGEG